MSLISNKKNNNLTLEKKIQPTNIDFLANLVAGSFHTSLISIVIPWASLR